MTRESKDVFLTDDVLLHRWFFGPGQILPPEKSPAAKPVGWTSPSYCDQCVRIQVYAGWSSFPKRTTVTAHHTVILKQPLPLYWRMQRLMLNLSRCGRNIYSPLHSSWTGTIVPRLLVIQVLNTSCLNTLLLLIPRLRKHMDLNEHDKTRELLRK